MRPDTIIVTGDRDSYQLVTDPHVRVLYNRRGVSDYVLYDEAGIATRQQAYQQLITVHAGERALGAQRQRGTTWLRSRQTQQFTATRAIQAQFLKRLQQCRQRALGATSAARDQSDATVIGRVGLDQQARLRVLPAMQQESGLIVEAEHQRSRKMENGKWQMGVQKLDSASFPFSLFPFPFFPCLTRTPSA